MKKFEETGLSTVFIPCWSLDISTSVFFGGKGSSSILWFYLWVIQVTNNFVVGLADRQSISSYPMWYQWYHQYSTSYPIMWYSTSWFKFNPNVTKTGSHVSSRWSLDWMRCGNTAAGIPEYWNTAAGLVDKPEKSDSGRIQKSEQRQELLVLLVIGWFYYNH